VTAPWRVKYDGVCSRCGISLPAGTVAVYERATRTIHCVECPPAGDDGELPDPAPDPGIAGGSALREYERRKAGREARVRDRFGNRLGGVVLALTSEPQSTRAWAIGAKGEEKLAMALEGIDGLHVLHDRGVRGTRGNIDHILIAPAGVFVIDAKNYEGLIQIRDRGTFFRSDDRLYVGRRDCSTLADGLGWQVEAVMTALHEGGVDPLPPVTPVLCFVDGDWPLLRPPSSFQGVRLEGPRSIRTLLTASRVLDASAIARLTAVLAAGLPPKQ
jgi:Nuclease-related domain